MNDITSRVMSLGCSCCKDIIYSNGSGNDKVCDGEGGDRQETVHARKTKSLRGRISGDSDPVCGINCAWYYYGFALYK